MTQQTYSRSARILHILIALLLAFQLGLGWRLEFLEKTAAQFPAYQLHKSVGISILVLSLIRVAIRFMHPRPAMLPDSRLNHALAKAVHGGFYLVMLGGPITGWMLVSTAKIKVPTLLFGMIPLPHLPIPQSVGGFAHEAHELLAWLALGLFVFHVAGALRHQFFRNENLLGRMLPHAGGASPISRGKSTAVAGIALLLMWVAHAGGWQWPFNEGPAKAAITVPAEGPPVAAALPAAKADEEPAEEEEAKEPEEAEKEVTAAMPLSGWSLQPGGTLGFVASMNGDSINGRFASWTGDIRFSPDDLPGSKIGVTIDLASADTSDGQRDEMLRGSDFFNIAAHPKARFTSNRITHKGGDRYAAAGMLDLHGVKRPVTLDFTLKIDGDTARASGSTRLDRTAFGVGSGDWAATDQIAGAVSVRFDFRARRQ
jgi:cytochrome b561/polyisoprenoid-binding protein YceI